MKVKEIKLPGFLFIGALLILCIGCGGKGSGATADGALDAYALLRAAAPSEAQVQAAVAGHAATKAAKLAALQTPPADTIEFLLMLDRLEVWETGEAGPPLPQGAIPVPGNTGHIFYHFYYNDSGAVPIEIEGQITFHFDFVGHEFVPAAPAYTIGDDLAVTGRLQGDVVNAIIDALTPAVRDGFLNDVAVTAIEEPASESSFARTAITGGLGAYSLRLFGGRTYTVKAFLNGFQEAQIEGVAVAENATASLGLSLLPAADGVDNACLIGGTVEDLDGLTVGGATVYLTDPATGLPPEFGFSTISGATGAFMLLVPEAMADNARFNANIGSKSGYLDVAIADCSQTVSLVIADHRPNCGAIAWTPNPALTDEIVTISAAAADADDAVLYYDFHAAGGDFLTPGEFTLNYTQWMTAASGNYPIEVEVCDGGLCCTAETAIPVMPEEILSYRTMDGDSIEWEIVFDRVGLKLASGVAPADVADALATYGLGPIASQADPFGFYWAAVAPAAQGNIGRLSEIPGEVAGVDFVATFFRLPNGVEATFDQLYARFATEATTTEIQDLLDAEGLDVSTADCCINNAFHLADSANYTDNLAIITQANRLTDEENIIEYAVPDLLIYTPDTMPAGGEPGAETQHYLDSMGIRDAWDDFYYDPDYVFPYLNPRVALLGSGVQASHEDLAGRIIDAMTVFDDDVVGPNNLDLPQNALGTGIAGIIGAGLNNGIGVDGINLTPEIFDAQTRQFWCSELGVCRWISSDQGNKQAISWAAVNHNAQVIHFEEPVRIYAPQTIEGVREIAVPLGNSGHGSALVAPVGDEAVYISEEDYPVLLSDPNILIVAALNRTLDDDMPFTNVVPESLVDVVNLGAPGESILTTDLSGTDGYSSGNYAVFNGTAAASAIIAGNLAMLYSRHPMAYANDSDPAVGNQILDYLQDYSTQVDIEVIRSPLRHIFFWIFRILELIQYLNRPPLVGGGEIAFDMADFNQIETRRWVHMGQDPPPSQTRWMSAYCVGPLLTPPYTPPLHGCTRTTTVGVTITDNYCSTFHWFEAYNEQEDDWMSLNGGTHLLGVADSFANRIPVSFRFRHVGALNVGPFSDEGRIHISHNSSLYGSITLTPKIQVQYYYLFIGWRPLPPQITGGGCPGA